jgi:hypothetical protein
MHAMNRIGSGHMFIVVRAPPNLIRNLSIFK